MHELPVQLTSRDGDFKMGNKEFTRGVDVPGDGAVAEFGLDLDRFQDSVLGFVTSQVFARLFKDGMALVEETAAYLDGPGREDSKNLSRPIALAYAGESMRLTTRLMQVASWLLVQRAIEDGEMTPMDAREKKYRLGAQEVCRGVSLVEAESLPERLNELLKCSAQIYDRVWRLDDSLYRATRVPDQGAHAQLSRLHQAFSAAK